MKKKKLVVLSGAGISAESGIATFRDAGGLWEGHRIEDVATPGAWQRNKELVLHFYNERRKAAINAQPNDAHKILVKLEEYFDVVIVTQNVDNLHEKAGSSHVIHLHGELFKSRSTLDPSLVYDMEGWELKLGDKCERGSQLRPHIVWFGEAVPMIEVAAEHAMEANVFIVVGTSLAVYPAAGLINYVSDEAPKFIVDPRVPDVNSRNMYKVEEKATLGMKIVMQKILEKEMHL